MFSFFVCMPLSCLFTLFIHLIFVFLSHAFYSWYFKDIAGLTGSSLIKHTVEVYLWLSQGTAVCCTIAIVRQQLKLKYKAIYVNFKISCPNWWWKIISLTFRWRPFNTRNSFKIGENRLSICEISVYALIFATPGTDSYQFSGYLGLSESGPECDYLSMSSEIWNAAKVSQAKPKGAAWSRLKLLPLILQSEVCKGSREQKIL